MAPRSHPRKSSATKSARAVKKSGPKTAAKKTTATKTVKRGNKTTIKQAAKKAPAKKAPAKKAPAKKAQSARTAEPFQLGTKVTEHAQTKPVWCSAGCALPIMASRLRWVAVVVADVWKSAAGRDMKVGRVAKPAAGDRWDRREVFHPECYHDQYGPVTRVIRDKPVRSRI